MSNIDSYKSKCANCTNETIDELGEPNLCSDLWIKIPSPEFYCQHHEFKDNHIFEAVHE